MTKTQNSVAAETAEVYYRKLCSITFIDHMEKERTVHMIYGRTGSGAQL